MALRAVVLAAGRGIRMGGTEPKTLIPVGNHEPLLYYTLDGLKQAGVDDLLVVTGFKPDEVQEFVTKHWGEATYVFNARYASWGNFHSVRVALDQSPGFDLLCVNSDIVVHPEVFTRVARTRGDLVLAVERRYTLDAEDMRVKLDGERVLQVSKQLPKRHSHGEFAGVSLLRPEGARVYSNIASDVEWDGRTQLYYEDIYDAMAARVDCRAAYVNEGEYAEVDIPDDMRFAAAVIERHPNTWGTPSAQTVGA